MVHLSITRLMKALSLTTENTTQNNLLEKDPLGLGLKFGLSSHVKDISFMQNYCGVHNDFPDTGLGQGADVGLGLIGKCDVKVG